MSRAEDYTHKAHKRLQESVRTEEGLHLQYLNLLEWMKAHNKWSVASWGGRKVQPNRWGYKAPKEVPC